MCHLYCCTHIRPPSDRIWLHQDRHQAEKWIKWAKVETSNYANLLETYLHFHWPFQGCSFHRMPQNLTNIISYFTPVHIPSWMITLQVKIYSFTTWSNQIASQYINIIYLPADVCSLGVMPVPSAAQCLSSSKRASVSPLSMARLNLDCLKTPDARQDTLSPRERLKKRPR